MEPLDELITAAKELADAISFDDFGIMIAGRYQGGHGGLISRETIMKADAVRRAIARAENARVMAEAPDIDVPSAGQGAP